MAVGARTQDTQAQATPLYVKRARSVWFVLFTSAVLFCVVCSASGVGLYGYLMNVTRSRGGTLQLVRGTQLTLLKHRQINQEAVPKSVKLNEGDQVTAGDDTEAYMTLFDESTIHLYFGTHLALTTLRTSRFFANAKQVNVYIDSGTAEISTPDTGEYSSASYSVETPHAEIRVDPSSTVRVQFTGKGTEATTQSILTAGSATVLSGGKQIPLKIGSMVVSGPSGPPEGTQPAEQDLVRNGDFSLPPTSGSETLEEGGLGTTAWLPLPPSAPTGGGTPDDTPVSIVTETVGEQTVRAAVIRKGESDNGYARYGLRQDIGAPASFFKQIELRANVKVVAQTAPIGGPQGEVYPLTIRVLYTDSKGKQQAWRHSFYWAPQDVDLHFNAASHVPQGAWKAQVFTLKSLGGSSTPTPSPSDSKTPQPTPTLGGEPTPTPGGDSSTVDISVIDAIEIYGLGTTFQSWITGISLVAR